MLTVQQQETLIKAAIFAPSADNSQPFLFEWHSKNELSLWIDETRSGKASDNRFVLSDIAIGAVIENIVIQASALNFSADIVYFPDCEEATNKESNKEQLHIARLVFSSANEELLYADLANYIPKRCTDRRFPFKGPIQAEAKEKLNESTKNSSIIWFDDKSSKKSVTSIIQQAESIRFKSEVLHQELFSTVKFDDPDSEEGMPVDVLAIEPPAKPMFKWISNWSVMRKLNKIGAYAMLGMRSVRIPINFSPALALICIKDNDRLSVIEGGRELQRAWLTATQQGLAVQPYAAPGIFSLGFINCESQFKLELDQISQKMAQVVKTNKEAGFGLMFLRLGYSKPIKHRSNRRPLGSFARKSHR